MSTIFVLLVFAYFVVRFEVEILEKVVLLVLIALAALLPIALPNMPEVRLGAAIAQGVIGIFITLRMHYLKQNP